MPASRRFTNQLAPNRIHEEGMFHFRLRHPSGLRNWWGYLGISIKARQSWSSITGLFAWPVVSADVSGSCSCLSHWRKTEVKNAWKYTYIWHTMSKVCNSVTSWYMSMFIILHCLNWFDVLKKRIVPTRRSSISFLPGSFFTCSLRQDGIQLL